MVYFNTMTVRIKVVSSYVACHSASGANVNSHMGLIPEIERVWISIDHKLFLWDYVDGSVNSLSIRNNSLTKCFTVKKSIHL